MSSTTKDRLALVKTSLDSLFASTTSAATTTSNAAPAVFTPPPEQQLLELELERELRTTREDLEKTIQDLEAANEELKSSNEELLSMNEELQSANEEMETSNEELQATNEELTSSNEELHSTNEELQAVNEELQTVNAELQVRMPSDRWVLFVTGPRMGPAVLRAGQTLDVRPHPHIGLGTVTYLFQGHFHHRDSIGTDGGNSGGSGGKGGAGGTVELALGQRVSTSGNLAHAAQGGHAPVDGLLAEVLHVARAGAEPDHLLLRGHGLEAAVRQHAGDHEVEAVGAEVECGQQLLAAGERPGRVAHVS